MKPYNKCKILGPYLRKDGRKHVCIYFKKKWRTVSYPKYLIELSIGRYLRKNETVDHRNNNFTDDSLDNLQIITRKKHAKLDAKRVKDIILICQVCNQAFTLTANKRANIKRTTVKSGPYCSKQCAGFASHYLNKYKKLIINTTYYRLKNMPG